MMAREPTVIDRRMAIGGVLAGPAGLALPRRQVRTVLQRGMIGGGVVQLEPGGSHSSEWRAIGRQSEPRQYTSLHAHAT
ncbi:MAG: hypothetical protein K0Q71_3101 [Thermomicrobiales bacterium]|nr:hypothetical protein [Thermomicrobiales bacterium]